MVSAVKPWFDWLLTKSSKEQYVKVGLEISGGNKKRDPLQDWQKILWLVGSLVRRRQLSVISLMRTMVRTDAKQEELVKDLKAAGPQRGTVCTKT